jgi:hypothetical protein
MKITSCLFFVFFIIQTVYAQTSKSFGIKAGVGLATFQYRHDPKETYYRVTYKWTPSFYGGFTASIGFNKFFFQPELLYSLRGFRFDGFTQGTRYGYISMPLLFGYKPVKKLGIVAGPEFGYIISSRTHFTADGNSNTLKYIDNRHTLDIDAGLAWYAGRNLSVEGRFVYSIKPLYNSVYNSAGNEVPKDGYSKVVQFGVTYRFKK